MEFLRAIGPIFNFLLLAGALIFLTRKRIRKLFRDRKERIADALGADISAVSVKATTEEHLGFTGDGSGIAAHAVCLIEPL